MLIARRLSELPYDQYWLMDAMKFLGYQIDRDGLCFGMSHMAKQALLANELDQFDERLLLIHKVFASISTSNNLLSVEDRHAQVKKKIQQLKLTNKNADEALIDILAFFDGIELLQFNNSYFDLLGSYNHMKKFDRHALKVSLSLSESIKLETIGGALHLNKEMPLSNVYTRSGLNAYFRSLREKLKGLKRSQPFALVLLSSGHSITVGYNPIKDTWCFIDANKLEKRYIDTTEKLAKYVMTAFSNNHVAIFSTELYMAHHLSKKNHGLKTKDTLTEWLREERTKALQPDNIATCALKYDSNDASWLHTAIYDNDLHLVEELIKANADIDITNETDMTLLHLASQYGHLKIVNVLINENAKVNAVDENGVTPLCFAIICGNISVVNALINANANVNAADEEGVTPIYRASFNGSVRIVKALVNANADVNAATKNGFTSLHAALNNGHIKVVNILIKAGADVNVLMKNGGTPIFMASQSGKTQIVEMLKQNGADTTISLKTTRNSLLKFAKKHHVEQSMEDFIKTKDASALETIDMTPLDIAIVMGHQEIADLLCRPDVLKTRSAHSLSGREFFMFGSQHRKLCRASLASVARMKCFIFHPGL